MLRLNNPELHETDYKDFSTYVMDCLNIGKSLNSEFFSDYDILN